MIRTAVCDDEEAMRQMLCRKIEDYMRANDEAFEIQCFREPEALLYSAPEFDVIFLDIQMPRMDGITLAKKLRSAGVACALIFVTVLAEHVYDAFQVEAVDYLEKPIDDIRFSQALDRVRRRLEEQRAKTLFIQTLNWCKFIKIDRILYCEVINRKVYLHTPEEVVDYYCKIDDLEKQLDRRFFRCHRSFLINLDFVCEYTEGRAALSDGTQIPVSRLRSQAFLQAMLQYVQQKG